MDGACRYPQHAPSKADSSGKAWQRSREIIELQQFHRKNAVLRLPGTAFFQILSQDIKGEGSGFFSPPDPGALFLKEGLDGVVCRYAIERIRGYGTDADPVNLYG